MEYPTFVDQNSYRVKPGGGGRVRVNEMQQQAYFQPNYAPRQQGGGAAYPGYPSPVGMPEYSPEQAGQGQPQPEYTARPTQYPPMTRERLVKFKTELCNYYTNKQICPFYSSCSFAHGEGEKRRNPVSPFTVDYKPEPCKEGTAKDINHCLNNNELYYHPENYKTQYCKTVTQGEICNRPLCAMAHTAAELKSKPNTNTLAYLARYQYWDKLREKLEKPEDSSSINPHSSYNFTRETVLHYVAKYGQADLCKRLIELGANVNSKDWKEQTPLHKLSAFGGGDPLTTARVLLEAGANKNALDTDGATPSSFASKSNQAQLLELLSGWGPDEGEVNPDFENYKTERSFESGATPEESESYEPPAKRVKTDIRSNYLSMVSPSYQVKFKYEDKLKMVKITLPTTLTSILSIIKQKFTIDASFVLSYQDREGDKINLEDDEDIDLFLENPELKKIIHVTVTSSPTSSGSASSSTTSAPSSISSTATAVTAAPLTGSGSNTTPTSTTQTEITESSNTSPPLLL